MTRSIGGVLPQTPIAFSACELGVSMLNLHPQVSLHLPQCRTCGLPMALARIEPDPNGRADKYTYECVQGHSFDTIIERRDTALR